jgi:hypothetical protein
MKRGYDAPLRLPEGEAKRSKTSPKLKGASERGRSPLSKILSPSPFQGEGDKGGEVIKQSSFPDYLTANNGHLNLNIF